MSATVTTDKKTETKKEPKKTYKKVEEKMGIVRYLQLHPQDYITEDLLKTLYPMDLKTEEEWTKVVNELTHSKIIK